VTASRRRVVVTGPGDGGARLRDLLQAEGLEAIHCPLIRTVVEPGPPLQVEGYSWVVVTSTRAVDPLLARAQGRLPSVAAIGPGTARALRERGIEPALVARDSTQEGLARELASLLEPGQPVLFAGAAGARDLLARELGADVVVLYRTEETTVECFPAADLVVLSSASGARAFSRLGIDLPCVSIGPITSGEARIRGLRVVAEAERHDADGLVEAVRLAASSR
jgi:uroporphyrinogen III methyltransferase / synthase